MTTSTRLFTSFVLITLSTTENANAQNVFGVVGAFPHYAVGAEWNSTIYLDVDGTGKNIDGRTLATCQYKLDFYNQFGALQHTERFTKSSDYSFRSNVVKVVVPDFNFGQLVYGPVLLSTDCSESYPVKTGELVFSQKSGDKVNDGTVALQTSGGDTGAILDLDKFTYGFAVYNRNADAKAFFASILDVASNTVILKSKLLFTLAGKEQKIFVVTDLLPELKSRKGMVVIDFSESPSSSPSPMYLMLKFNSTGLFSTGMMYWTLGVS